MAGCFLTHGWEPSRPAAGPLVQRPAVVSQVGRLLGQQCCPSSQQVALGSGQHAQLKQKLKKLDMQQHVLPEGQEVVPASSQGTGGSGPGAGPGGLGPGGAGLGGLGVVFTGYDAIMAMPHCPGDAPGAPRLRTSLM
mmetsp:Transcript_5889/g.16812  ORF Transcript_5889/g.16812 Transcript_5889/m.16812 type:complete len:137 (-) Transcript_5889:1071-1481(-)